MSGEHANERADHFGQRAISGLIRHHSAVGMHQTQPFCLQNIIAPHVKFSIIEKSSHRGAHHLQNIADRMQMFARSFNEITGYRCSKGNDLRSQEGPESSYKNEY